MSRKDRQAFAVAMPGAGASKLKFHMGQALIRLAATYPRILEVVLEQVQNALDSRATTITVLIDMVKRCIEVTDNGNGASVGKFESALCSIGKTIKRPGDLGRFGLGLISPIGKCARSTFMSIPSSGNQMYHRWTFDTRELERQADIAGIPREKIANLRFSRSKSGAVKGITYVPWRTKVTIEGFSDDAIISKVDPESLGDAILEKYSVRMIRQKACVTLRFVLPDGKTATSIVEASDFAGKPLDEIIINHDIAGAVVFRLFLAPLTPKGRRGKVLFGEVGDDHRLNALQFTRTSEDLIDEEAASALRSGIFEGEILGEKISLLPSRRGFVKNEELLGFCAAIEQWYRDVGFTYVEKISAERQERRYQELGLRSLRVIEALTKSDPSLMRLFDSFKFGHTGDGHTPPERVVRESDRPAMATSGGAGAGHRPRPETDDRERREPRQEKTGHHPAAVIGPEGKRRLIVRHGSFGIQFQHLEMPGSSKIYVFDRTTGVLTFNIRHPFWVKCDVHDTTLMRFQEAVAIQAITLALLPEDWENEAISLALEEALRMQVFVILNGDTISGRRGAHRRA